MSNVPESLGADELRRWSALAQEGLARSRAEIDSLNVFPVPDGDTGTNLFLTCESAAEAVEKLFATGADADEGDNRPTRAVVASAFASGALLGARGNSGVITSQILLGFSRALEVESDTDPSDSEILCRGFDEAVTLAYQAVAQPREGTILSVIKAAAEGARLGARGPDGGA
ncbi:MAG: DAK2 domain-containing protein, partial [Candidatus Nanopelagicales bacterium]|nr:DAK2 domain-containing protein [Candidatus Nanopelagicales bacterium]